ncbi:xanthine dehydrogenase family protein molybdopterin-binding subunit [Breoghania sp. L-A4]|uniref:xanthine dehydrogenase family protein molybdopterin-binding subunit n=1 Tax=Breoghania sp. L-A4 TaxID=2304600 RepID=UPI000E3584F4|nr:xanthine dehydrogenase family protein molybdopterin-binding subunit [Breoghania sp. L-A4]AXS41258.1 xanthine dehydrogenase family protein molybdopterin-binding subunit [Breoghania sp. L-A4]
MNQPVPAKFGVGAPVRRKEDPAFITGHGNYVGDVAPEGALIGYMLRSPVPHATFKIVDKQAAVDAEGVHLVLTADDITDLGLMPTMAVMPQVDGTMHNVPPHEVLCSDTVRFVGDAIAFIVADSLNAAKSAGELIEIDYETLPVVVETGHALDEGATLVWPDTGTNQAFELGQGDKDKADAAFARATKFSAIDIVNNRLVSNYLDTRGCVAEFDTDSERYTLTVGTQGGHSVRDIVAGKILKIEPAQMRVVTPDVGGGFGTKMFVYPEYPLVCVAARRLGKPVKWIGERMDHFVSDAHGRDNVTHAELAMDDDGKILGMRVDLIANMGAYLHQFGPYIPFVGTSMTSGLYDIPAVHVRIRGVFTNTVPVDAYRGAGRPEAAYLIDRLMDKAALDLGVTTHELRARNFIPSDALPYTTQTGRMYDTGDFAGHMTQAMKVADWAGFDGRVKEAAGRGKYRGIGMSTYIEACAFAGSEEANLLLSGDGTVSLMIGTQSNGQGHATAYGQLVAEYLGIDLEHIEVIQGDTDRVRTGGGTGGSRSIPIGLPSVNEASKTLVEQIKKLAAEKLEAGTADLELVDGAVRVVGTDQAVTLAEIASTAPDPEMLKARGKVKQDENTYPNGTHICEVEIDPELGTTEVIAYTIVDDFGVTVNPMLLEGQVHGGVAQAIGQALLERTVYDADGQLLTASFLDYTMPRAQDLPDFHFETRNIPSTTNAMGIKGAGEAGTIGGCGAVMNAVGDALRRGAGVTHIDMPATPARVWEAIQAAKA